MADYETQVADRFRTSDPAAFGAAGITGAEVSALRGLLATTGSRWGAQEAIYRDGYPLPTVTADEVALAGSAHACGVTAHLAETRGFAGRYPTYESYTAKNRFDRFVALHLPADLRGEWQEPIARQRDFVNPTIGYPEGVSEEQVYGIGKPSRYFIAQTMRHLEFARLGKLDPGTAEALQVTPGTDRSRYAVYWDTLVPVIKQATDVVDLAGVLGANVAQQLLKNGLSPEQVAAVLRAGYDVQGMEAEHGRVHEAYEVHASLMANLLQSTETAPLVRLFI